MRVLMMLDWNPGRGGTENYATSIRGALRAAGDEVEMLTSSAGSAGDGAARYVAFGTANPAAQAFLQIANPLAAVTVGRAVREFRPQIVWVLSFAYHLSPAAVLAAGDVPLVLLATDYKLTCPLGSLLLPDGSLCTAQAGRICHQSGCLSLPHWLRDSARYAGIGVAVRRAHRVLACSGWLRDRLRDAGVPAEVLHLPVEPPPRDFAREPSPEPVFLFCGRLEREKGVDLLLGAFARLCPGFPGSRLRIAGSGSERTRLERWAHELGIASSVDFLGWLPADSIERELARAWASVVPSRWAEPLGLVAAEAIVRGVCVIASDAGGLREIVDHGSTGLLFPRGDEDGLLDRMRTVASGLFHSGSGVAGDQFGMDRHVAALQRVFSEVAAGVGNRRYPETR